MIKRFFKDSAVYSVGTILSRGIQIILLPLYTRLLSTSDYGIIDILAIVGNFINVTVAFEITQGFARYYSDAATDKDRIEYSSTSFWFVISMFSFFLIFALIFSKPLNEIIIGGKFSPVIFQVALISIYGSGLLLFLQNQLRWYLLSKEYALVGIIFTLVSYSATVVLLIVFKTGVIGVFWGMILGYGISSFVSWYQSRQNYKMIFDWKKCKEMLSFSIPLVPSSIGAIVLLYIDRIAIKSLMTLGDVGIFGIGYRFAAIITVVLTGFQTALIPLIYQNYKDENTPKEIAKIFRYFLAIIIGLILTISIFSMEALHIFTTPGFYGAARIIPLLCFVSLLQSMYIFTPGLSLAKKTKLIAIINVIAGVLNTALNFLLIPYWGLIGSSIATVISSLFVFIITMYYNQKLFHIPHQWKNIVIVFFYSMIFIFFTYLIEFFIPLNLFIRLSVKVVVLLASFWILFKFLIKKEEFVEFLRLIKIIYSTKGKSLLKP